MTDAAEAPRPTRRIELTLRRPWFALYAGIRPTLVIGGRGQPTQWGVGTWQLADDEDATIGVFLFTRGWRFGDAEASIPAGDRQTWEYRAPALPFGGGRLRPVGGEPAGGTKR